MQTIATVAMPAIPTRVTPSFAVVSSVTRVGAPGGLPLKNICDTITGYLSAVANVLEMTVLRQLVMEITRLSSFEDRYIRLIAASGLAKAAWLIPEQAQRLRNADAVSDGRRC